MVARLMAVVLVSVELVGFAACGGADDDDTGSGGDDGAGAQEEATSTPRPKKSPTAAPTDASSKLPANACDLVTLEEAQQFSPLITAPRELTGGDPKVSKACVWQFDAGRDFGTLKVSVRTLFESETVASAKERIAVDLTTPGAEEVKGIGQFAVYYSLIASSMEIRGITGNDLVVEIGWTNPDARPKKEQLLAIYKKVVEQVE